MATNKYGDNPESGAKPDVVQRAVEGVDRAVDRLVKLAIGDSDGAIRRRALAALHSTGGMGLLRLHHLIDRTKDRGVAFRALIALGALCRNNPVTMLPALTRVLELHEE